MDVGVEKHRCNTTVTVSFAKGYQSQTFRREIAAAALHIRSAVVATATAQPPPRYRWKVAISARNALEATDRYCSSAGHATGKLSVRRRNAALIDGLITRITRSEAIHKTIRVPRPSYTYPN